MAKKKEVKLVKLDLGCGPNKLEGFIGVDQYKMKGVDVVCNVGKEKLPYADNSVDEIYCAHFIEHLTNFNNQWERTHFFNEVYRVLKKGVYKDGQPITGFARLIFPHWCSQRYYGDPTHKEPFSEMGFSYLSKEWRDTQAPHADKKWNKNGYSCDFDVTWYYNMREDILSRNPEFQQNAMMNYKEVIQDVVATMIKK